MWCCRLRLVDETQSVTCCGALWKAAGGWRGVREAEAGAAPEPEPEPDAAAEAGTRDTCAAAEADA